jgi:hypothetical protein
MKRKAAISIQIQYFGCGRDFDEAQPSARAPFWVGGTTTTPGRRRDAWKKSSAREESAKLRAPFGLELYWTSVVERKIGST